MYKVGSTIKIKEANQFHKNEFCEHGHFLPYGLKRLAGTLQTIERLSPNTQMVGKILAVDKNPWAQGTSLWVCLACISTKHYAVNLKEIYD